MNYLEQQGVTLTIELGPKNVLSHLFKYVPAIKKKDFDHLSDWRELIASMGKKSSACERCHTLLSKCLAVAVSTPNINSDPDQYRQGVLVPYKQLHTMALELEKSSHAPGRAKVDEAFGLFKKILATKGLAAEEQTYWCDRIFNETAM